MHLICQEKARWGYCLELEMHLEIGHCKSLLDEGSLGGSIRSREPAGAAVLVGGGPPQDGGRRPPGGSTGQDSNCHSKFLSVSPIVHA